MAVQQLGSARPTSVPAVLPYMSSPKVSSLNMNSPVQQLPSTGHGTPGNSYIFCNYCKKRGHTKETCYKLQRKNAHQSHLVSHLPFQSGQFMTLTTSIPEIPQPTAQPTAEATSSKVAQLRHDEIDQLHQLLQSKAAAQLATYLAGEFDIKHLGVLQHFLGIEVAYSSTGIFLCQRKYITDLLQELRNADSQPLPTPIEVNHRLSLGDHEAKDGINLCIHQRVICMLSTVYFIISKVPLFSVFHSSVKVAFSYMSILMRIMLALMLTAAPPRVTAPSLAGILSHGGARNDLLSLALVLKPSFVLWHKAYARHYGSPIFSQS
ncbi:uncharacterized protein LOC144708872 [Wolffia australiana]